MLSLGTHCCLHMSVGSSTSLISLVRSILIGYTVFASCRFLLLFLFFFLRCKERPTAPTVRLVRVEQTSISLSWEISKTCFESVDFTVTISWSSASSGEGQATNVSGSSYDIAGLTPGVKYDITLVAIGDGVRSDSTSISVTTLPSGEHNMYICMHFILCTETNLISHNLFHKLHNHE